MKVGYVFVSIVVTIWVLLTFISPFSVNDLSTSSLVDFIGVQTVSAQESIEGSIEHQSIDQNGQLEIKPSEPHGDDEHSGGHSDPFAVVLLELALVIGVAMIGRWAAAKCNQASVLGELVIGVVIGNIGYYLGLPFFVMIMHLGDVTELLSYVWTNGVSLHVAAEHVFGAGESSSPVVSILTGASGPQFIELTRAILIFSNLGVILLLFKVGLESSISEMLRVGIQSLAVAIIGIVVPFLLGVGTCMLLLPDSGVATQLFLGATLTATSVGITARVFKDLRKLHKSSAKIVLGAAVIDDILGLIILAVVVGIVNTGEVNVMEVGRISLLSLIFLGAAVILGDNLVRIFIPMMKALDERNCKLLFPLILAFLMSWVASLINLAAIIGAFAAGLILNEIQFESHPQKRTIEELVEPLEVIFAPIFFVLMGMQVNLSTFAEPGTLLLACAFTVVAIIGKIVCGLPAGKNNDPLSVGLGMIPRGEVGLIFASIGRSLGVVDDSIFSALVVMVMVTTLITPPMLTWSLRRWEGKEEALNRAT